MEESKIGKGIKFKGTHVVHKMKTETKTWCGMEADRAYHADPGKRRVYTYVETQGLLCQNDVKLGMKQPEHVLCSRCNMWELDAKSKQG